jgi:hypothetical protein
MNKQHMHLSYIYGGGVNLKIESACLDFKKKSVKYFTLFCMFAFIFLFSHSSRAQQLSFTISHDTVYVYDLVTIVNTSTGMPDGTLYKWCFSGTDMIVFQDSAKWTDDTLCAIIQDTLFVFKTGYPTSLPEDTLRIILVALDSAGNLLAYTPYPISVPIIAGIWPIGCLEPPPGNPCFDNFVCNGDFEDITTSNLILHGLNICVPWLGVHSEVFNANSSNPAFSVPNNMFGLYRPARSGVGYAGFHPRYGLWQYLSAGGNSESITGMVKYDMYFGQTYDVIFYAALSSYSNMATPLVAYLNPNASVISNGVDLANAINVFPQWVVSNTQSFITNTFWTKVEGVFSPPANVQPTVVIGAPNTGSAVQVNGGCGINSMCLAYYYIDDVEVYPQPAYVELSGTPGTSLNGCLYYEMIASNPKNVASYQWCVNGVAIPGATGATAMIYSGGYSIECVVRNYHGCGTVITFETEPPCISHHSQGSANDIIIDHLTTASDLMTQYTGGSSIWSELEPINILGTLTIDQDFTFNNCPQMVMGRDARIVVEPGVKLSILESNLYSCNFECFFWDGIYATDPTSTIEIHGSQLSNAKNAVYSRNNPELDITSGNTFSYNLIGIHITNHQRDCSPAPPGQNPPTPVNANVMISGNTFSGDLNNYYAALIQYLPNFNGMEWGIRVDTVDLLKIGTGNTFDGLSCGIHINIGNVSIDTNSFL